MQWTAAIVAACVALLVACGFARRDRVWDRMKQESVTLGTIGSARMPKELRARTDDDEVTADEARFIFRRVNDTHWNGQTSYAEQLKITVFAADLDIARIEKDEPHSSNRWGWTVTSTMYDRDPVHEPAWRIVLLDREQRVHADWLGYQKQYTVETAKQNLLTLLENLRLDDAARAALFTSHRDWPEAAWKQNYQSNLATVRGTLGGVPEGRWQADGPWLYAIDDERPQRLLIAYRLGARPRAQEPIDLGGPVTFYRFVRGYWWQNNQGSGGGVIGNALMPGFQKELADPEQDYYYSIQTANLWRPITAQQIEEMKQAALDLRKAYLGGRLVRPSPR